MFVSGVELGFWPGDFGFLGSKTVVVLSFAPSREMFQSPGDHDAVHHGLRQAHFCGERPDGVACRIKLPDCLSIDDDLRPAELLALLSGALQPHVDALLDQISLQFGDSAQYRKNHPPNRRLPYQRLPTMKRNQFPND